ncbi:MAG: hypothetical protein MJ252_06010 [archaeon]|nr:hypothetical protein [archaeon]
MNTESNFNTSIQTKENKREATNKNSENIQKKPKIPKSKLNLLKSVHGFNSILNNSTNYWKDSFSAMACGCNRTEPDEQIQQESIFKKTINNQTVKVGEGENKTNYTKEWTQEELDILKEQYYTLGNTNFRAISGMIKSKTPAQCSYKIKKIEERKIKKPFTRQDDINLIELANKFNKDWVVISQYFEGFSPEALEERYTNKLDPKLKRTKFSSDEDDKILRLYNQFGNDWKEIASYFPDRNANMIKNRFYSFLKKKNNIKSISSCSNSNNLGGDSSSAIYSGNDYSSDLFENIPNKIPPNNNIPLKTNIPITNGISINNISPRNGYTSTYSNYLMDKMNRFNSGNISKDIFNPGQYKKMDFNPIYSTSYYNKPSFGQMENNNRKNSDSNPNNEFNLGSNNNEGLFGGFNRKNSGGSDDLNDNELQKNFMGIFDENIQNNSLPTFQNSFENNLNPFQFLNNTPNINIANTPAYNNDFLGENDIFMETCQKIFPFNQLENNVIDFNDSGSGNDDMNIERNSSNNNEESEISQPLFTVKSKEETLPISEEEVFSQTKKVEEMIQETESFLQTNKLYEDSEIPFIKNYEILNLIETKTNAEKIQQTEVKKLNELKDKYIQLKMENNPQNKKESVNTLIQINDSLLLLIKALKDRIDANKNILIKKSALA